MHAIAFSDKDQLSGRYVDTTPDNFSKTMLVSCYSFTALAQRAEKLMPRGGALLTLTYYGAEKWMQHYNVMGVAKAALERTESRGGHTRDDHPGMDSSWRKVLLVCSASGDDPIVPDVTVTHKDQVPMRPDLLEAFEVSELEKYYTEEELADHPGRRS